jgi:hypothetical protein
METSAIYEIRIKEQLGVQWAEWFAPLVIHHTQAGGATLVGPICDQAALHGILVKLRDLNLTLLGVNKLE